MTISLPRFCPYASRKNVNDSLLSAVAVVERIKMSNFADMNDIEEILSKQLGVAKIRETADWAAASDENFDRVYQLINADDERTGINALWVLTFLVKTCSDRLYSHQDDLIDIMLVETHHSRKRLIMKLLREQRFEKDRIRTDFLDYCLTRIISECEPYAVRAFCIYCAYNMCRHYPELLAELTDVLDMLTTQPLSPGLRCALRTTLRQINLTPKA